MPKRETEGSEPVSISVYSVFTAFLWFNLFILILSFLRKQLGALLNYQITPLVLAIVLSLIRLLIPFEPSFSVVLRSEHLLPSILHLLRTKYVVIGTVSIPLKIVIIWMVLFVSALLIVIYMFRLHTKYKRMKKHVPTTDPVVRKIFEQVKRENPSTRECELYILKIDSCPYVYSYRFSAIVLPDWIYDLSPKEIHFILQHEWQHFLNHDCTIKVYMEGLFYLLWWNPFIFLLKRDLNQTLELKCDKKLVANMSIRKRKAYRRAIVAVARKCFQENKPSSKGGAVASIPFLGLFALSQKSSTSYTMQRLRFILDFSKKAKNTISVVCITCLMLLFVGSFCFTVQPYILPPEESLTSTSQSESIVTSMQIVPETSYLADNHDGTYSLFVNEVFWLKIHEDNIKHAPFCSLPIIE